jgi:recombination protein RecT
MTTQAVATQQTAALQKFNSVATLLQSEKVQNAIARALPRHITPERMIRVAMTAIQKTPKLAECDQRSLISAIVQAAELGLEPNTPLGHAYLIPYFNKNTKRTEAQLMPGYRGFMALARRSGQVQGIYAEIVYEKDFFEITYGLNKDLIHKPALNEEDRGQMVGAYAVAKFKDGYTDFEYMDAVEIGKIRKRSKSPDNGPWVTDTGEMWRKTPIRRLAKRLPLSIEDSTLQKAIEIDDFHDAGFDADISPLELGDGNAPEVISEEQRIALVNAAKESGQDLSAIVNAAGFELVAHITVDRYDELFNLAATPPSETLPHVSEPDVTHADAEIGEAPEDEAKDEEMKLADLRIAVTELYRGLEPQRKIDAATWLGTREIKKLKREELESFLDTFA